MAELKPKKFGYVVHPPHPPAFNAPYPPPPPPPPGISTTDWIAYINSYIDVRARQLYDKLKSLYQQKIEENDEKVHQFILFADNADPSHPVKQMYVSGDTLYTTPYTGTTREAEVDLSLDDSSDEPKS